MVLEPIERLNMVKSCLLQCQSLIEELLASHSTDLQQRAYELQAILSLDARAVEKIMPVNSTCDEIEVMFSSRMKSYLIYTYC